MNAHKQLRLFTYAGLFLLPILTPIFQHLPVQAMTSIASVYPSSLTVELGQDFDVSITISNVLDLYGWEFVLDWDPYLLEVENVTEGPFLKESGRLTFFTYNISQIDGRVVADCTLLGWVPGVSGSGTLSTLTFHTKNYGECPLELYNVSLIDSNEQLILCQTSNGSVRVISPHDVAVDLVGVSPLLAPIGDPVNIDVTVQNQGSYGEVIQVTVYINSTNIGTQQVSLSNGSSTHVFFTWNTTAYTKGNYQILAAVDPVPEEVDFADNTKTAVSLVTLLTLGHDVSVVTMKPAKTVVGQGFDLVVAVEVSNCGVFNETFNITFYSNITSVASQSITLTSGNSTTISLEWSTTAFAYGNYTLSTYAWPVTDETETSDNTLVFGQVAVTIPGDINGDFAVNILDAITLGNAFLATPASYNWNPNADIDGNGAVNILDAIIIGIHFQQHYP